MKNLNDYKGTKTAIYCKTQEEWDYISGVLGYKWLFSSWNEFKEESCINASLNCNGRVSYYVYNNYTIIPASDFMPTTRTIEQIETELEVLRNELELLKAQTPKKKPIEFVKFLRSNTMSVDDDPLCKPSRYKHVELVFRYDHYDIIKAWSRYDKTDMTIYLGHFNDGIK